MKSLPTPALHQKHLISLLLKASVVIYSTMRIRQSEQLTYPRCIIYQYATYTSQKKLIKTVIILPNTKKCQALFKKMPNSKKMPKICQTMTYMPNKISVPNHFKKCQISGIWHKKCEPGNPESGSFMKFRCETVSEQL